METILNIIEKGWDWLRGSVVKVRNFFHNRELTMEVQTLLKKVYLYLFCSVILSAVGVGVYIFLHVGGYIPLTGLVCCWIFLYFTSTWKNSRIRVCVYLIDAFIRGVCGGQIIQIAYYIKTPCVITGLVAGAFTFLCFRAASFSKTRDLNYFIAFIFSTITVLIWLFFAPRILGGESYLSLTTYGGFLVFFVYVCNQTEVVVKEAEQGDLNAVNHTINYFSDFLNNITMFMIIAIKLEHDQIKSEQAIEGQGTSH